MVPDSFWYLQFCIAETWTKRQLTPLKPDNQTIQARDYSVISLNARQLTAFWSTLILKGVHRVRLLTIIHFQS